MLAERFRLISAAPIDADTVISAFEARATTIQKCRGCTRITALQRAVDENPERCAEYCRAMDATRDLAAAL